jgi:3-oxoacyl-[acyl-carrier-protein] synthase-3
MRQTPAGPPVAVRISGTGMAVPQKVLTNDDLAQMVDTSDDWINRRTGIRERRIGGDETTLRELSGGAMRAALSAAGIEPGEIDFLILATLTPEMCCPSTAARVVAEIGATPAGAMDISAACSGFVYGLNTAASLIMTGHYRHIGVVGAELLSRIVDWSDRGTCILFGDGAGAAVVSRSDNPQQGCLFQSMASDGGAWHSLYCPQSERDLPADRDGFSGTYRTLQMDGREVYKFAVSTLQKTIIGAVEGAGIKIDDLAMIVPHQSNQRILESARDRLGIPDEKMYSNIDRYGNTSAASVPICLSELMEAGRIKDGDLVLMVGLGGGLTWASSLWRM